MEDDEDGEFKAEDPDEDEDGEEEQEDEDEDSDGKKRKRSSQVCHPSSLLSASVYLH
jgi:hypothetical protein